MGGIDTLTKALLSTVNLDDMAKHLSPLVDLLAAKVRQAIQEENQKLLDEVRQLIEEKTK